MPRCKSCGTDVPKGYPVCLRCGTPLNSTKKSFFNFFGPKEDKYASPSNIPQESDFQLNNAACNNKNTNGNEKAVNNFTPKKEPQKKKGCGLGCFITLLTLTFLSPIITVLLVFISIFVMSQYSQGNEQTPQTAAKSTVKTAQSVKFNAEEEKAKAAQAVEIMNTVSQAMQSAKESSDTPKYPKNLKYPQTLSETDLKIKDKDGNIVEGSNWESNDFVFAISPLMFFNGVITAHRKAGGVHHYTLVKFYKSDNIACRDNHSEDGNSSEFSICELLGFETNSANDNN